MTGHAGQLYHVVLTRLSDGATERISQSMPWTDGTLYWWTEGNYGCDCNRYLAFERAQGRNPWVDPNNHPPCGDGQRYRLDRFEFEDGTSEPCEVGVTS